MKGYKTFLTKLKKIKKMGYIPSHRSGNTGIGKTLEDLLGIKENNIPGPNGKTVELKSARKESSSMLTLFTKSPLPRKSNTKLLKEYGYTSKKQKRKKELHTTVNAKNFNTLKHKKGFKIDIQKDRLNLVNTSKEVLCYWSKEVLQAAFERKLPKLLYVKAQTKRKDGKEQFWFNEAWLLNGFNFSNFLDLLKTGIIFIDIRIGQYPDGRIHDHGTAFRVRANKLDMCFKHREKVA